MSLISLIVRTMFTRSDNKRDAGLTTPDAVRRFDDICYGPEPKWNVLDVYRPRSAEGALPVIVSIHGGGWVYGDKERYQYYCMSLAERGFAVVNFTYRLAPKFKYPAPIEDTEQVFSWIFSHAGEYGFDCRNLFALGDSAGAQTLSLYCVFCTDRLLAAKLPFSIDSGHLPKAVALNCGVYHLEKQGKADLTSMLMRDFLPQHGTAEELQELSAADHVNAAFPPAFIMTAEGDFLVQQAPSLVEKLKNCGVQTEYRYYGSKEHVLGHVFHLNLRLPEAAQCNDEECEFFRSFMEE